MRQSVMHALALVLVFVLARVTLVPPLDPEPLRPHERYVIVDQHVRNVIAADWDAHANDPAEVERAYCVTFQKDVWVVDDWVWRAVEIAPATDLEGVTPHSITFRCPFDEANVTSAHTHPFQTCVSDTDCVKGGTLAGQCMPSDDDRRSLRRSGKPFALLICSRDAILAYYP